MVKSGYKSSKARGGRFSSCRPFRTFFFKSGTGAFYFQFGLMLAYLLALLNVEPIVQSQWSPAALTMPGTSSCSK